MVLHGCLRSFTRCMPLALGQIKIGLNYDIFCKARECLKTSWRWMNIMFFFWIVIFASMSLIFWELYFSRMLGSFDEVWYFKFSKFNECIPFFVCWEVGSDMHPEWHWEYRDYWCVDICGFNDLTSVSSLNSLLVLIF